jgi:hypothetical protein
MTLTETKRRAGEPDPLAVAILWDGYYAETFLASVNGVGTGFAASPREVKQHVLEAVRWLLDRGLVTLFSVDKRRAPDAAEVPWNGTVEEQLARLDAVYTIEAEDWHEWAYACWFANTEAGDALAERYPPEPWSDDDE